MNITETFARELKTLAARPLEGSARDSAVALFIDGLAVAALGAREAGPRLLADFAFETGGRAETTLIGHGAKSSAGEAARVNGAAMHALDYEPMWNPANHALSTTLPAILALAECEAGRLADRGEKENVPGIGKRMLSALATGIEAQARLRLASGQFEPADLIFHPPGAVGPIGSAVACATFLGLSQAELVQAIGIAASRAGGVLANVGSMTKALHCGGAAAAGLEAALLAAKGFTADSDALGGPRGFCAAFFGKEFSSEPLTEPRSDWHIVEPGPAFKLYPSQYGTHFVICAARDAHAKLPVGSSIKRVRIICPHMPYVDRVSPASGLAGKFSFQYTAAVALLDGNVTVESFSDARRFSPDVVELLQRIELAPDASRQGRFDRMSLDIRVECDDGTVVETHCDGPPGIWGRPASPELLRNKARDCFSAAYGTQRGERILSIASGIEGFRNADLVELMSLMSDRLTSQGGATPLHSRGANK